MKMSLAKNRKSIVSKGVNETLKTIYLRRAIRKFKEIPIKKTLIEQIIDAGKMAPSAMNNQNWRFYVVRDKKQIHKLSMAILPRAQEYFHLVKGIDVRLADDFIFHSAPVIIFITAPTYYEWAEMDIGMCSQNMMLAAKSFGIDSCPIGLSKFLSPDDASGMLGIPDSEQIHIAIVFGYGNEKPELSVRKMDNVKFA